MSRTFKHKPLKLIFDYMSDEPWKWEYYKYSNSKCKNRARQDNRKIRHSLIDEENNYLTNAIAEYKRDIFASDKYW